MTSPKCPEDSPVRRQRLCGPRNIALVNSLEIICTIVMPVLNRLSRQKAAHLRRLCVKRGAHMPTAFVFVDMQSRCCERAKASFMSRIISAPWQIDQSDCDRLVQRSIYVPYIRRSPYTVPTAHRGSLRHGLGLTFRLLSSQLRTRAIHHFCVFAG